MEKFKLKYLLYIILLLFLIVGTYWRYRIFSTGFSFFSDEFVLITKMDYLQLLTQSSYHIPIGFALINKIIADCFGTSELVLRFSSFFFSIVLLFVFYFLSLKIFKNPIVCVLACFIFTFNENLLEYSAMFKQYSSDVLISVISIFYAINLDFNKLTKKDFIFISLISFLFFLMSYTYFFIFTGIILALFLNSLLKKVSNKRLLIFFIINFIFFLCVYFLFCSKFATADLFNSFIEQYECLYKYPKTFSDIQFLVQYFFSFFANVEVNNFVKIINIIPILFILGIILMFKISKKQVAILTFPIFLTYIAALFEKYPFQQRLVLFLFPAILILILYPLEYALNNYKMNDKNEFSNLFIILLYLICIIFNGSFKSLYEVWNNRLYFKSSIAKELYNIVKDIDLGENERIYSPGRSCAVYYYYALDGEKDISLIWSKTIYEPRCNQINNDVRIERFEPGLIIHIYLDNIKFYENCYIPEKNYIESNYKILDKKQYTNSATYYKIET